MTIRMLDRYASMRFSYLCGAITEEQWNDYCMRCLEELMQDNEEVLKRLKNI